MKLVTKYYIGSTDMITETSDSTANCSDNYYQQE